jgi:predicted O-linked N-acetylglucosamine transferase (SPINDLY family)
VKCIARAIDTVVERVTQRAKRVYRFVEEFDQLRAEHIDYILADRVIIPETERVHYREKVVYLPDTYLPNDDRRAYPAQRPSRAEFGFPPGFIFASFNNSYKFSPEMFDI